MFSSRIRAAAPTLLALAVVAFVAAGCCSSPCTSTLPSDLPSDPALCASYCKVWVPPVYRERPRLVQTKAPCNETVPVPMTELRVQQVCVKPVERKTVRLPGKRCEQAVVQTKPGGWKWRQVGDCWKYCYEPPCYQWCNKVVEEEGIEYCTETTPEYQTVVTQEPVTRYRQEYVPGEYKVVYDQEVYRPGHWEWQVRKDCGGCECPAPCPTMPCEKKTCRPTGGITGNCPRVN
jgi:hypothetical protein